MNGSQVSSGRQGNEEMLNRSAVVVRFRKPYVGWLRSGGEFQEPGVTLEQLTKTIYLVPNYEACAARSRRPIPAGTHVGRIPGLRARLSRVGSRCPAKKPAARCSESYSPSRRLPWVERRQLDGKPRQIKDADNRTLTASDRRTDHAFRRLLRRVGRALEVVLPGGVTTLALPIPSTTTCCCAHVRIHDFDRRACRQ